MRTTNQQQLKQTESKYYILNKNEKIMPKDNLQLISARIDSGTLDQIEKFTARHSYWKRNTIINCLLMTVFQDFNDRQIYDMVRRNHFKDQNVKAEYEITDYVIRQPNDH